MALPSTPSTRLKANNLLFQINTTGSTWKDFSYDCTMFTIKSEDASNDSATFYDATVGGAVDIYIETEMIQSTDAASLWTYLYSNPGKELPFRYAPWGNGDAAGNALTSDKPGYTGTLRTPRQLAPGIGGAAGVDNTFTSETVRMDVVGTLTTVSTGGTWTRA
jgi:hypothetical protein